jgi:hypothetical protein
LGGDYRSRDETRRWAGTRTCIHVTLTGQDYASWGTGGGDALMDVPFGSALLLRVDPDHPYRGVTTPGWVLVRAPVCPVFGEPRVLASVADAE